MIEICISRLDSDISLANVLGGSLELFHVAPGHREWQTTYQDNCKFMKIGQLNSYPVKVTGEIIVFFLNCSHAVN